VGDPGAESVFLWTKEKKGVNRRGAGPMDASLFGRGAGEGLGVHICTGPVYVRNAEPGDVIELRIMDVKPRPCANPAHAGKTFGSNAAAWWGFHYKELMTEPKPREVITIYEIDATGQRNWAKAVYNFQWTPQTDPFGVVHKTIDYPGVPVDHSTIKENHGVLKNVQIPIRPHFGVIGLAPKEADIVDSIPPGYFGGNIDNWRIGKGATMYYPVSAEGGLLSVGDPHASQGDSELCGTAIDLAMRDSLKPVTLADISERQKISLSYLEQLFGKLRRRGLVSSVRGPGGGYQMAKKLEEVSVADIIRAVDEPIDATQCGGRENCKDDRKCLTHDLWASLNDRIFEYLNSVTLAQMVVKAQAQAAETKVMELKDQRARRDQAEPVV